MKRSSSFTISVLMLSLAIWIFVADLSPVRAKAPALQTSFIPASVFLNAMSTARTFAGPALIEDKNPSGARQFFLDTNTARGDTWLTVQNVGDTSVTILRDGTNIFTIPPGRSATWEFVAGVIDVSYAGQGDGSTTRFVWAIRERT